MRVLERGWVSSNNIVLFDDDDSATLIDTGYVTHSEQTLAAGAPRARRTETRAHHQHALAFRPLRRQRAAKRVLGATIIIPPGHAKAVERWDDATLGFSACGQACDRFNFDAVVRPGERLMMGGTEWQAFASPGHDPHSIVLWNSDDRTLISADALWEHGFGAIFPEVEGESGFAEQRAILELIEEMQPRLVIPGHGAPFTDVDQALARAFARLDALEASPERNARSVIKTLIKFHLLIVRQVALDELDPSAAADGTTRGLSTSAIFDCRLPSSLRRNVDELVAGGALQLHNGIVANRD